tara:strand:- start:234 stop:818 length:585 start_codon:yes stop_codon:yes gene_type:complete
MNEKVLIIIPARLGSKRLKNKNILPICNIPMFVLVSKEASKSKYSPIVFVSSESKKILDLCKKYKINFIKRPSYLAGDSIEKQDVIVHAYKKLKAKYKPTVVVSLQVNTPQFNYKDLDKGIYFFKNKLYPKSPIKELISVGNNMIQNGAFRIMTPNTVCKKTLSTKVGIIFTNYIDIHNAKQYKKVKFLIEKEN